jgi:predicted kinase
VPEGDQAPAEAYTPEARRQVYATLGERAATAVRDGSVVVDATFGDESQRDAFLDALGEAGRQRLRLVVCGAPVEVRAQRAGLRAPGASDAGPDVVRRLGDAIAEPPVPPGHRLAVDTTAPVGGLVDRLAAWLDGAP